MNEALTKKSKRKRIISIISAIFIASVLLSILVLMLYPLYGHFLINMEDIYYSHIITINGIESEYLNLQSIKNNGFISFFIKGNLYTTTDEYNVYRWKIVPNSNVEYLLFEPTKEPEYKIDFFNWRRHSMDRLEICRLVTDN